MMPAGDAGVDFGGMLVGQANAFVFDTIPLLPSSTIKIIIGLKNLVHRIIVFTPFPICHTISSKVGVGQTLYLARHTAFCGSKVHLRLHNEAGHVTFRRFYVNG
jgi:hypothetical protein